MLLIDLHGEEGWEAAPWSVDFDVDLLKRMDISADTTNGQFVTGTIQTTGILAAGRNSIPQVTTKRAIYLTPR